MAFIKLDRKFFDHRYWKEPREYSRAEAWLDLIQSARFEASDVLLKGRELEVRRGEIVASRRYLEKRWGWSNTKVDKFLEYLEASHMIAKRKASGITVLTLCKYDNYNVSETCENASETPVKRQRNASETPNIKKEKEREELEEVIESKLSVEKNVFDRFRKKYPGVKRGLETEFENFKKKHRDWRLVLDGLETCLDMQIEIKQTNKANGHFVPLWKNLQTYLNQRCWEDIIQLQQQKQNDNGHRQTNETTAEDRFEALRQSQIERGMG